MYYIYIIYSFKRDRYDIGYSRNLQVRLEWHNAGWNRFTKSGIPWELKYYEEDATLTEAIERELEIKRWKSRKKIESLIESRNKTTDSEKQSHN